MSSSQTRCIALVQMSCGADPQVNLDRAIEKVQEAIRGGAKIICLPELFRSQYFCQQEDAALFDLAENIPGPTTQAFCGIAKTSHVVIIVPLFERRAAGIYHNSVVVVTENGKIGSVYRKMHIPDDPAYYEKFYFTPGDQGFQAVPTSFGKVGPLICWDQWYPEAARLTALQGADMLFYPTAIGWHPSEKSNEGTIQHDAWQTVQRAHAITNGVFVASVNRVGFEQPVPSQDGLEFWGGSFVCDPFGMMITQASSDKEEVILAEINLGRIEEVRRNWPFLRDRRIDAYEDITRRYLDQTP